MNKFFYTISALLLFFFSIHSSLVFAQDSLATDTLVAYYPFSGNADDSSGFGNDGQVFGATLTKDRFGNENGAYRFNGTNDFIDAGSSESLAITGDLSLSFWFNADSFTGLTSGIITYQGVGTSGSENNALYKVNFPNENVLNYNHEGNEGDDNVRKFENVKLNTFQWYHTVLTRDTLSKKLKVYIDGELVDSASFDIAPSGGENAWLRFGENHGTVNWDRFFDGILDDIRIYNYVISDSTIQNLYKERGWPETKYETPDTLVAYYPFSGNARDSSGFANNGEVFGATLTKDRFGNENSAYEFDSGKYINSLTSFDYEDRSISLWVKPKQLVASYNELQAIFSQDSDNLNNGAFKMKLEDGVFKYQESLSIVDSPDTLLNGTWYHLTMIKEDTIVTAYLNGKYIAEQIVETHASSSNPNPNLIIGASRVFDRNFVGDMDDIRIYNYAITDSAIQNLYKEKGWPETRDTTLTSNEIRSEIPDEFKLHQNYPNPFNPSTIISYDLPEGGAVSVRVYDLTGRLVATLVEGNKAAGRYQVTLNAAALSSGVYFYELKTDRFSSVKKFTLIK